MVKKARNKERVSWILVREQRTSNPIVCWMELEVRIYN